MDEEKAKPSLNHIKNVLIGEETKIKEMVQNIQNQVESLTRIQKIYNEPTKASSFQCKVCETVMCKSSHPFVCKNCVNFFQRSLSNPKQHICLGNGNCLIKRKYDCRSCRLDRCLLAGLDETNQQNCLPISLVERKQKLFIRRINKINVIVANTNSDDVLSIKVLNSLIHVESLSARIYRSSTEIPTTYYDNKTLPELLEKKENVLNLATSYEEETVQNLGFAQILDIFQRMSPVEIKLRDYTAINGFLSIEIAKSMPIFALLDKRDQLIQLKYSINVVELLNRAFYSYQKSCDVVIFPNGIIPFLLIREHPKTSGREMASIIMKDIIESFFWIHMSTEEFVLLRAMILSKHDVQGLSESAKVLLKVEGEKFARILRLCLRNKMGEELGTRKYKELLELQEILCNAGKIRNNLFAERNTRRSQIYRLYSGSNIPPFMEYCFNS